MKRKTSVILNHQTTTNIK